MIFLTGVKTPFRCTPALINDPVGRLTVFQKELWVSNYEQAVMENSCQCIANTCAPSFKSQGAFVAARNERMALYS